MVLGWKFYFCCVILVVCRIDPLKEIESAIKLARVLKDSNIGKGMKIVGSISPHNLDYYSHLNKLVEDFDLCDYVTFETNTSLDRLLSIMREAKVYFHPMVGEHFRMSVAEAMARWAGSSSSYCRWTNRVCF